MPSTAEREHHGATLMEIAAAGGVTHTTVRQITKEAFPRFIGGRHRGITRDLGELLAVAFRSKSLSLPTARLLRSDPAAVLAGAEALAELARRAMADQDSAEAAA